MTRRRPGSEIPGRQWRSIPPQAQLRRSGLDLGRCIALPISRGLLPLILLVVPGQPALDLHQVAIHTGQQHLADLAPIPINLVPLDRHRLPSDLLGQALLGDIAECLPPLRRINAAQSNFVLGVGFVQDCDAVAVLHMDDLAQQGLGLRLQHQAQHQRGCR